MLRRIDRILLRVPSLPAAVRYYTSVLGMTLLNQDKRLASLKFADSEGRLCCMRMRTCRIRRFTFWWMMCGIITLNGRSCI